MGGERKTRRDLLFFLLALVAGEGLELFLLLSFLLPLARGHGFGVMERLEACRGGSDGRGRQGPGQWGGWQWREGRGREGARGREKKVAEGSEEKGREQGKGEGSRRGWNGEVGGGDTGQAGQGQRCVGGGGEDMADQGPRSVGAGVPGLAGRCETTETTRPDEDIEKAGEESSRPDSTRAQGYTARTVLYRTPSRLLTGPVIRRVTQTGPLRQGKFFCAVSTGGHSITIPPAVPPAPGQAASGAWTRAGRARAQWRPWLRAWNVLLEPDAPTIGGPCRPPAQPSTSAANLFSSRQP